MESLRALAVVGVVVAHAMYWASTAPTARDPLDRVLAVATEAAPFLLFVLSGALLFGPFARRDLGSGGSVSLRRYAVNRAVRILPVYYMALVLAFLLDRNGTPAREWALYATFSQNALVFPNAQVNRVMWFMAIEVQFYLVLPLLAFLIARVSRGRRVRAAVALGVLGAASFGLFHYAWHLDPTPDPMWRFSLPSTFFFLAAGMALSVLRISWEQQRPEWLRGPLGSSDLWALAALTLVALAVVRVDQIPSATAMVLIAGVSVLLVGACVLPLRPGLLVRALEWRPLAVVGVASYSLLLCHDPVLEALAATGWAPPTWQGLLAIGLPLSLLVALISYTAVEAPFLRLRRHWARSSPTTEADPQRHTPPHIPQSILQAGTTTAPAPWTRRGRRVHTR